MARGAAHFIGKRPNILFCIADDWGWPHASAYGDPVVRTPAFDRIAREGVLFRHASPKTGTRRPSPGTPGRRPRDHSPPCSSPLATTDTRLSASRGQRAHPEPAPGAIPDLTA
ncbi:MAG: sulfatase-like hydrolase/transferase [Planctomycetota bacterium]